MHLEAAYSRFKFFKKYILIFKYFNSEELRNKYMYVYKHGSQM